MSMGLSLVIINETDSEEYCKALFASMNNQPGLESVEKIFIDNASGDRAGDMAKAFGFNEIFRFPDRSSNRPRLYNQGLELASQENILFAHSDVCFQPDFFRYYFSTEDSIRAGWVNFPQYYADQQRFGLNGIYVHLDKLRLVNRQIFDTASPRISLAECSESCFKVKRIPGLKFDQSYQNSYFEYEYCRKLSEQFPVNTLEGPGVIHYFMELQDKQSTFPADSREWTGNNLDLLLRQCKIMTREIQGLKDESGLQREAIWNRNAQIERLNLENENCKRRLSKIDRLPFAELFWKILDGLYWFFRKIFPRN